MTEIQFSSRDVLLKTEIAFIQYQNGNLKNYFVIVKNYDDNVFLLYKNCNYFSSGDTILIKWIWTRVLYTSGKCEPFHLFIHYSFIINFILNTR